VNWDQALTYCRWRGGGLPSEAEWEKAASWNAEQGEKTLFPWGNTFTFDCSYANTHGFEFDCVGDTTRVGSYPQDASPTGLMDMGGNVTEWVADWYDAYPGNNAWNPYFGTFDRVLRGSAWCGSRFFNSALRAHADPVGWDDYFGFRCARKP
jgi:formylglycine-generating enzyme required for sulfatase activity